MNHSRLKVLLRRLLSSIIILFLLISFIFIMLRLSPGNPLQKFISPELSPQLAEHIKESFGLNDSILSQYFNFVSNFISGDLGTSYNYRVSVLSVIMDYLPFTIIFSLISFFVQLSLGAYFAILSAKNPHGLFDRLFSKMAVVVYALPAYVLGVILIYVFSLELNLLPSTDLRSYDFAGMSFIEKGVDYIKHMILPIITLSLGGVVIFYKYLRDNLGVIFNKSFVLNLRAMGMPENEILRKHVIPNALGPFISIAGVELGILFGGALITEVIFGLPGMGRLTVNAILVRDYPLIVGCSFISGILILLTNFLADFLKVIVDKRLIREILN